MPLPPDRIAFTIPYIDWPVYWYGITVTLGTLAAAFLADREARIRGHNPDHVWNALILAMILGLVGARLYHVVSSPAGVADNFKSYLDDPRRIFGLEQGGLSGLGIFGGIFGGALGVWLYTKWAKLRFSEWADICAVGLPIGQAIGRWGNWFNQELYGNPTKLPWGIPIESQYRLPAFAAEPDTTRFHPTFLYESLWCVMVFFILAYVSHQWREELRPGDIALMYCILYPAGRFLSEMQRPDAWMAAGLPVAQIISLAMIGVAGLWLLWRHDVIGQLRARTSNA